MGCACSDIRFNCCQGSNVTDSEYTPLSTLDTDQALAQAQAQAQAKNQNQAQAQDTTPNPNDTQQEENETSETSDPNIAKFMDMIYNIAKSHETSPKERLNQISKKRPTSKQQSLKQYLKQPNSQQQNLEPLNQFNDQQENLEPLNQFNDVRSVCGTDNKTHNTGESSDFTLNTKEPDPSIPLDRPNTYCSNKAQK